MLSSWIVYILLGRMIIWSFQQFPLPKFLDENRIVRKLHECDFCSGVWGYGIFSYLMQLELLGPLGFQYVPVFSELVTGVTISFMVHIFVLGWKTRFEVVVI